jgi:hypothetical protein
LWFPGILSFCRESKKVFCLLIWLLGFPFNPKKKPIATRRRTVHLLREKNEGFEGT